VLAVFAGWRRRERGLGWQQVRWWPVLLLALRVVVAVVHGIAVHTMESYERAKNERKANTNEVVSILVFYRKYKQHPNSQAEHWDPQCPTRRNEHFFFSERKKKKERRACNFGRTCKAR